MISRVNFPPSVDAGFKVKRLVPDKAIFWPTAIGYGNLGQSGDSTKFPQLTAIKARKSAKSVAPLLAFVDTARKSLDRILVLDDYLFKPTEGPLQNRIDQVLMWFSGDSLASDIRLLTSSIGDADAENDIVQQFNDRARKINSWNRYPNSLQIHIKFTLQKEFPYVHDRFSIIDDELWHFGATVGGLHDQVNAATRGWDVNDHDALEFFNMAWAGDSDLTHSHDYRGRRG